MGTAYYERPARSQLMPTKTPNTATITSMMMVNHATKERQWPSTETPANRLNSRKRSPGHHNHRIHSSKREASHSPPQGHVHVHRTGLQASFSRCCCPSWGVYFPMALGQVGTAISHLLDGATKHLVGNELACRGSILLVFHKPLLHRPLGANNCACMLLHQSRANKATIVLTGNS